ncbi:hypothetical protein AGLY_009853 [Aphis glycines]|uniref:Uncharacterized protein n=1 Tax=Aphis glycines TaxID=307491 RepID=A0A6G0TJ80_APHGL|nr:hypothetical protein AGLY_009853 [Aphis glycines]
MTKNITLGTFFISCCPLPLSLCQCPYRALKTNQKSLQSTDKNKYCFLPIVLNIHLDGTWYPEEAALPARKGKCLVSNLSSIQSSIKSLITELIPSKFILTIACLSIGDSWACCINLLRLSSDIPFFDNIYNIIILILSLLDTFGSCKTGDTQSNPLSNIINCERTFSGPSPIVGSSAL